MRPKRRDSNLKKNHKGGSLVQLSWCPFIRGSTARVIAVSLALPLPQLSLCLCHLRCSSLLARRSPCQELTLLDHDQTQEWRKYNFRRSHPSLWDNAMAGELTGQQTSEIPESYSLLFLVEKIVFGLETLHTIICFISLGFFLPALWISSPKWMTLYDDERLLCWFGSPHTCQVT